MKKKIVLLCSIFLCVTLLLTFNLKKNKITILGDYILNISNNKKYNFNFSSDNLDSTLLLEYLDYNALDIKEGVYINSLIKKSQKIFISVGMNDLLNYVSLVDNRLIYNPTVIYQKIALLEYNVNEIINSILAINDVDIYYLSLYYLNDSNFDEIIKEYNYEIKSVLEGINVNYLEINDLIKVENYKISIESQNKIFRHLESIS